MSVPMEQCPFLGVSLLMWSIEIVDGRPRVLTPTMVSASWMNAQSLLHIDHCDEKPLCEFNKTKKLIAMAASLDPSQCQI